MTKDASFKKVVRRHDAVAIPEMDEQPLGSGLVVHARAETLEIGQRFGVALPSARVSAPAEVPEDILEQVRALCLALPEVTVRVDHSLTRARSTAHSFDIRRRSFCLLVAVKDRSGKPVPMLVLRADPYERKVLLSIGHPFFAPRAGRGRLGVRLTDDTDWEEIRELVIESYRVLAPKKLTARLD
jgi:hypothetical protein